MPEITPTPLWLTQRLPGAYDWRSIAYGWLIDHPQYVAVATSGVAARSSDGMVWRDSTLPAFGNWFGIAYGADTFVAVGFHQTSLNHGGVTSATSPDGDAWTPRTVPFAPWKSVAFGNDVFVAVAGGPFNSSSIAATSPDGITWTQRALPVSNFWMKVCFVNDIFIVVGYHLMATSPDGITWTMRTLPSSSPEWNGGVAFMDDLYLAVGTGYVATSPNAVTWTAHACPVYGEPVVFGGSFAINGSAIGMDTSSGVLSAASLDGIAWDTFTLPANGGINIVGNGLFVSVAPDSATALTQWSLTLDDPLMGRLDDAGNILG